MDKLPPVGSAALSEVAGLVLASGMSRRFAGRNKLLVTIGGVAVVRRTVQAYLDGGLHPVLVVVGHEAEQVLSVLRGLPIAVVRNPAFEQGQSRALVRGVGALPRSAAAAVIGVGDQPLLTGEVVEQIVQVYRVTGERLVVPRYGGRRGNPALFDRSLFVELMQITGDQGGRPVLERHREEIAWLDLPDARLAVDIDTPEDYRALLDRD